MKTRTALALSLFFLCRVTLAAPEALSPPVCREFLKQPTKYQQGWLLGYLSGINARDVLQSAGENKVKLHSLAALESPDQVFSWMQDHCKKNPDHDFSFAGFGLWLAIGAQTLKIK